MIIAENTILVTNLPFKLATLMINNDDRLESRGGIPIFSFQLETAIFISFGSINDMSNIFQS